MVRQVPRRPHRSRALSARFQLPSSCQISPAMLLSAVICHHQLTPSSCRPSSPCHPSTSRCRSFRPTGCRPAALLPMPFFTCVCAQAARCASNALFSVSAWRGWLADAEPPPLRLTFSPIFSPVFQSFSSPRYSARAPGRWHAAAADLFAAAFAMLHARE